MKLTFRAVLAASIFMSASAFACVDMSGSYNARYGSETGESKIQTTKMYNGSIYSILGTANSGDFVIDGKFHTFNGVKYKGHCTSHGFEANLLMGKESGTMKLELINEAGDVLVTVIQKHGNKVIDSGTVLLNKIKEQKTSDATK